MTAKPRRTILAAGLALSLSSVAAHSASLTYRGTLQDGGKAAEGAYDIRLSLYSAATGGTAIGSPITLHGVTVRDGAFSTQVDVGAAASGAGMVYVAAAVAPEGSGDFVALDGRTPASTDAPAETCDGTWALDGNSGNPSGSYLGTADNQPLIFKVNGVQLGNLSSSPVATVPDAPDVVFGGANNKILGAAGATIAGGGRPVAYCGSGGGSDCSNVIGANGSYATISGGHSNTAMGYGSVIPGGIDNVALQQYSFAGGMGSYAYGKGSFVWSDSSADNGFGAASPYSNDNAFSVRATGGVYFISGVDSSGNPNAGIGLVPGSGTWGSYSDRNAKTAIAGIDVGAILEGVLAMPVTTWQYKAQSADIRHIGPMAQDFFSAFHVGDDNRHITEVDEGGVAFAAIQGLNQKLEAENAKLQKEIADLHVQVESLANKGK